MQTSSAHGIRLSTLLAGLVDTPLVHDPEISGITLDSRAVQQGWLFIAVPGARTDGRAYIAGAYSRGAVAAVYEVNGFETDARNANAIGVRGLRQHVGTIADRFFEAPSRKLKVVGVTGTNGKTTTTHLLAQVLDRLAQALVRVANQGVLLHHVVDLHGRLPPDQAASRAPPYARPAPNGG